MEDPPENATLLDGSLSRDATPLRQPGRLCLVATVFGASLVVCTRFLPWRGMVGSPVRAGITRAVDYSSVASPSENKCQPGFKFIGEGGCSTPAELFPKGMPLLHGVTRQECERQARDTNAIAYDFCDGSNCKGNCDVFHEGNIDRTNHYPAAYCCKAKQSSAASVRPSDPAQKVCLPGYKLIGEGGCSTPDERYPKQTPLHGLTRQECQQRATDEKAIAYDFCDGSNCKGNCDVFRSSDIDRTNHYPASYCCKLTMHVVGFWKPVQSISGKTQVKLTYGTTATHGMELSSKWGQEVTHEMKDSLTVSANAEVPFELLDIGGGMEYSHENTMSSTVSTELAGSLSTEVSSTVEEEHTETYKPSANATYLWQWVIMARRGSESSSTGTKEKALTAGRWEKPRCLPGYAADPPRYQTCHDEAHTIPGV